MAINLATKYSKKVADKFYQESVILGKTSKEYDWDGVKSIVVHTITTQTPGSYTRSGTSRYGTPSDVQDTVQTMQVTQDKSVSLVVDKGDNVQQNMIKNAGKVVALELREQFVPMADKYALGVFAEGAGTGIALGAALTKQNIADAVSAHVTALMNASASLDDAYCFIGATDYAKLVLSPEFLGLDKLGGKALGEGVVGTVRGLKIIPVPDAYMPTSLTRTDLTGKDAKILTFKKQAVLCPQQIKDMKVHEDAPGISGALMEIRWLFDAFVLDAKNKGVVVQKAQ